METNILTCLTSRRADLYMLRLLMLESIFERVNRPWLAEAFRCHCQWDGQNTEWFSITAVSLGCFHYFHTKVCSQMTSGGDLCHVGTSKLICETNLETGSCVIQFLPQGRSETIIHHYCGSGKCTTVSCFNIGRGDTRVPAPSRTWGVESFWSIL